ncbi:MAG: zinc ribbon domain-containing protein [Deltaproteobacteria bacterium]|nr:zinc ribbon domain-containing protein [Deltaproteobacteria bacterium]
MPIYEFYCASCGDNFEELVTMGTVAVPCPACGGMDVNRRVSACGFTVKGGNGGRSSSASSSCSGCSSASCAGCGSARQR